MIMVQSELCEMSHPNLRDQFAEIRDRHMRFLKLWEGSPPLMETLNRARCAMHDF